MTIIYLINNPNSECFKALAVTEESDCGWAPFFKPSLDYTYMGNVFEENSPKQKITSCTCENRILFWQGCICGNFKKE
jgi:hypothetical protein